MWVTRTGTEGPRGRSGARRGAGADGSTEADGGRPTHSPPQKILLTLWREQKSVILRFGCWDIVEGVSWWVRGGTDDARGCSQPSWCHMTEQVPPVVPDPEQEVVRVLQLVLAVVRAILARLPPPPPPPP